MKAIILLYWQISMSTADFTPMKFNYKFKLQYYSTSFNMIIVIQLAILFH